MRKLSRREWALMAVAIISVAAAIIQHFRLPTPICVLPVRSDTTLTALDNAIRVYRLETGCLPPSLTVLTESNAFPIGRDTYWRGTFDDEWGNAIQYSVVDGKNYELRSPGPDGIEGTEDDMVRPGTTGPTDGQVSQESSS